MTMKQTQTKCFDFSDAGLDFSAGSKNLFPDRFKKVLSVGYNTQTVSSVSVAGNQVTLGFGVNHGYAVDRVLKLNSPQLAGINDGQFVIDSVSATTVTLTIDNAPLAITTPFTCFVAPLGYELMYEQANVHVYKFKHIDNTDLFLRLCFQNVSTNRNVVCPCIGKSFDAVTGFITDANSIADSREVVTPVDGFMWEFSYWAEAATNNSSYTQAFQWFGKGVFVGSLYHFVSLHNSGSGYAGRIMGFLSAHCHDYDVLKYPVILGETNSRADYAGATTQQDNGIAYLGNIPVGFDIGNKLFAIQSTQSFLSSAIDSFNTTTAQPIMIYERATGQYLGHVTGGAYVCKYPSTSTNRPSIEKANSPSSTYDIDLNQLCFLHAIARTANNVDCVFLTFPMEAINAT